MNGISAMNRMQRSTTRRRGDSVRVPLVLALLCALTACARPPREAAPPPVAVPAPLTSPAPARARVYRVDPARTEVRVLTFRGGPLARLGHSHVLISRDVAGRVALPDDAAGTTFALDEPDARASEGPEFATVPKPEDVAGTRRNLLGPQVLDAAAFPSLRVTGVGATGGPADYTVHARIELRGRATPLDVPVHVDRIGGELVATGEFRIMQSALGLTPFSVALGALQVRDELVVRFRIVADRAE